ncbi:DUF928 domain-containing protein [Oscillatoriales cyanobacterium LEGE 11467]|uniref:DUF928 domain-containing protein n=1 Tax=Zarconia navalis LEGE 11467 TaxID=1828826 RepID=A0A928VTU5_9CYAN|nr:DUF928 domain-containing protein [Zarconia navalis]MBE9039284.1 DUF928 domain-containing protein [Zarconia navalis LEGE 11467]
MAWKNPIFNLATLSLGLSLELAIAAGFSAPVRANSAISTPNSAIPQTWQLSQFNPPDRGAPDVAVGGATRGELCGVTPLIPKDTSKDYGEINPPYFGLTVAERPTFFFHIEKQIAQEVFFEVYEYNTEGRGKDGQLIYETNFSVSATPGILSTKLPPSSDLEAGKTYRWYLDIVCGNDSSVEVASTSGWVERVDATPELSSKLVRADTTEARSQVYADTGIWFDALNILGQERIAADTDTLKTEWENLLEALNLTNLEGIANAPFMDCCNESVEVFGEESALTSQN